MAKNVKTVEHKLFSINESVKVPEITGEHVLNLIHMTYSSINLTDFKRKMEKDSYFSGIDGIEYNNLVHTAGELKRKKNLDEQLKLKYIDDIYLQIAQYDLRRKGIGEEDKMNESINEIYSKLYEEDIKKDGLK